ncbi:unnamed protein product [Prorocentrum cordatum]|uniref:Uncharacterized protein n=1 Tax=Prorocentrum cordatum TaxID=2364126 RepID=A0ABN9U2A5_9DINO|nr:unnamed protein product [Polarella glacialis]
MAPPRSTVHDSTSARECHGTDLILLPAPSETGRPGPCARSPGHACHTGASFRKRRGGERAPPRWSAPKRGVGCRGHSARPPETCSLPGQLPERGEEGEEERREGRRRGRRRSGGACRRRLQNLAAPIRNPQPAAC